MLRLILIRSNLGIYSNAYTISVHSHFMSSHLSLIDRLHIPCNYTFCSLHTELAYLTLSLIAAISAHVCRVLDIFTVISIRRTNSRVFDD